MVASFGHHVTLPHIVTGHTASVIVLPHQQESVPVVAVSSLWAMGAAVASASTISVMMSRPGAVIFVQGPNCVEIGGSQFDDPDEVRLPAIVGIGSIVMPITPEQPTREVESVVLVEPVISPPVYTVFAVLVQVNKGVMVLPRTTV